MKNTYVYCLIFFIFSLVINSSFAQNKIDGKALQEDLQIIEDIIKEFSFKLSEEELNDLEKLTDKHKNLMENKSLTAIEFFNYLSYIDWNTQFDEHASISVEEDIMLPLLTNSKLFPIPIKILENKVVVNSEDTDIPFGSILHSVNGISFDSLFIEMIREPLNSFSRRNLERQFSILYLIKKGSSDSFEVSYSTNNTPSKENKKKVAGVAFNQFKEIFSNVPFPSIKSKLIETAYFQNGNTFLFQLNSFSWDEEEKSGLFGFMTANAKKFDKEFKKIFKEIASKNVQNLIIDLRFNTGGNIKVPGILYQYIANASFTEDATLELVDFNLPHVELIRDISGNEIQKVTQVKSILSRYEGLFSKSDSTYIWKILDNETKIPVKNAFKGKVYLLVGGKSISASSYFTALFKSKNRGVIIGDELGGSHKALTAGQLFTYQLPNSGIKITAPLMLINFSKELYNQVPENKIEPKIRLTIEEKFDYFINKKDGELEKALEIIKNDN